MVRSWNVLAEAACRGLRQACASAMMAIALATNVEAQEMFYDLPPEAESYVGAPSILAEAGDYGGPNGTMPAPPPNYYYPP